jgi:hypothetical protein
MDDDLPSTILYPNAFRNSPTAGNDGIFDWARWSRAIDTRGIAPMDIDANVEINNFFLWAETKDDGVPISRGQQEALDKAVRSGLVTVIYQWGKRIPVRWQLHTWLEGKSPIFTATSQCPWWEAKETVADQIATCIRCWARHHRSLDPNAWRRRMIEAALRDVDLSFRQILYEQLRKENRDALGKFADTPLGRSVVDP